MVFRRVNAVILQQTSRPPTQMGSVCWTHQYLVCYDEGKTGWEHGGSNSSWVLSSLGLLLRLVDGMESLPACSKAA